LAKEGRDHLSTLQCHAFDDLLRTRTDGQAIYTLELPWTILHPMAMGAARCDKLVMPAALISSVYYELKSAKHEVGGCATPLGPAAGSEDVDRKKAWYERGKGWKHDGNYDQWGPSFHIHTVRLAYMLSAMKDITECIETVADIICPEKDIRNAMKLPTGETVILNMVKLDTLTMLHHRMCMRP